MSCMQLELMESLHHLLFHLGEFAKGIQSVPTYFFFAPKVYLAYYFSQGLGQVWSVSLPVHSTREETFGTSSSHHLLAIDPVDFSPSGGRSGGGRTGNRWICV
jgi:hypothetical protein